MTSHTMYNPHTCKPRSHHEQRPSVHGNVETHKYWYAPDYSDGRFACTGCGRCIKQCPVSLDIREIVLNAIADDAEAK